MLAVLLASSVLVPPAPAHVYYEQTVSMTMDGRATRTASAKVYWAGRRMRLETGDAIFVLQLDTGQAFRLLPAENVALQLDADRLQARSQLDLSTASDAMDVGPDMDVRESRLGEVKTIAGYRCQGHRLRSGSTVMDVFLSSKVPLSVDDFAEFLRWTGASQSMPGLLDALRELPGFPLETRARLVADGHTYETVSTITRLTLGPQPAALFAPPPGYRVEPEGEDEEN
jgi:hypothetical protein